MGTRCNFWGYPERELQPWALFLFTFKDASSSDGLLGSVRWSSRPCRRKSVERLAGQHARGLAEAEEKPAGPSVKAQAK
jgi:hypothetical protein